MIVPEPLTSEDLLKLYYYLKLNRSLEDRLAALYRQAIITATVFTSRGQEAISVGSAYALGPDDFVSPLTRNMGTMLVRGVRPRRHLHAVHGEGHQSDRRQRTYSLFW